MVILFCGISLNRADILKTFEPLKNEADVFFIENFKPEDIMNPYVHTLGQVVYWKDFSDAFKLLEKIKPDKLVFILLDNYYHFALFAAAKKMKIPVLYLDHGIRFEEEYENAIKLENTRSKGVSGKVKKIFPIVLFSWLRNTFFRRTCRKLNPNERELFSRIYFARGRNYHTEFMRIFGGKLIPDFFVLYSPETWRFYKKSFSVPENTDVKITYTGIPSLDEVNNYHFLDLNKRKTVLFIDQPFHEQHLLGWTSDSKINFFNQMAEIIATAGFQLMIKPHPGNEDIYSLLKAKYNIAVLKNGLKKVMIENSVSIVGSFNSTLLLPFCAMADVVTFCMENHPVCITPAISQGITKYKTAIEIRNVKELNLILSNLSTHLGAKAKNISKFSSEVLFAIDDLASQRTLKALLE